MVGRVIREVGDCMLPKNVHKYNFPGSSDEEEGSVVTTSVVREECGRRGMEFAIPRGMQVTEGERQRPGVG